MLVENSILVSQLSSLSF